MIKIGFGCFLQINFKSKTDVMWLSHKAVKIHNFYNDRDLYKQGVYQKIVLNECIRKMDHKEVIYLIYN